MQDALPAKSKTLCIGIFELGGGKLQTEHVNHGSIQYRMETRKASGTSKKQFLRRVSIVFTEVIKLNPLRGLLTLFALALMRTK